MKLYNTYTNAIQEFQPIRKGEVSIYVCGPTVYNYIHIGNARPVVFFDTVRRYFEYKGYLVKFASNFTDVDDKIIQRAIQENKSEKEVSEFYIEAFLKDLTDLHCHTDYIKPKVTEYMSEIINYIKNLVDNGFAYEVDGDVYFRVNRISDYGKLSNRKLDDLISGARVDVNPKKESPLDFTLWKKTEDGIKFDSPFSCGRPGWHTECVAMIDDIFHDKIDIHGGGSDLVFPHHENEIAQAKAMHDSTVAQFWMHNGRVNLDNEKMSKSIGNVIFVKDFSGNKTAFRLFLLLTQYRSPINYSEETFDLAEKDWLKTENTLKNLFITLEKHGPISSIGKVVSDDVAAFLARFTEALDNDFNTPNAITEVQGLVKLINQLIRQKQDFELLHGAFDTLKTMLDILGLPVMLTPLTEADRSLFLNWEEARKMKDFDKADFYRQELVKKGLL